MQEELTMLGISSDRAGQLGEMLDSKIESIEPTIRTPKDVSDFLTQMDKHVRENVTEHNEQAFCYIVLGMTIKDALHR